MTVLLHRSDCLPTGVWDCWAAIGGGRATLDPARAVEGLAGGLEAAFDAIADEWLSLARRLGEAADAPLSHTPSAAPNASDLGLMMAWTKLVQRWAEDQRIVLVLCDDPWMFRHLADLPGVTAGAAPVLWPVALRRVLRGYAARARTAIRAAGAALRMRGQHVEPGGPWLLVYGHPKSTREGGDAYFADCMKDHPGLRRALHVDAPPDRAATLLSGRTCSLHGWGNPLFALSLAFKRWRPQAIGPWQWLVRRASAMEGGRGQAAAVAWQMHCQRRWLAAVRPQLVAWPWENHAWERDLVHAARACGTRTVGYQHSVIGRQMLNYGPGSCPDGQGSLPDEVVCNGQTTLDQLVAWGVTPSRLTIGGALRYAQPGQVRFDPNAPVFLAVPFDHLTAQEMLEAARDAARSRGLRFVLKDHPLFPFPFEDGGGVTRSTTQLEAQDGVSAVVFAATTVGLEALLMGIPALRFRPTGRVAIDILPSGITAPVTSAATLADDLMDAQPPVPPDRASVFAPVDAATWRRLFSPQGECS
ncbi:MAG: hypothetical protein H7Z12_11070 [Rhodospirillaceae bacterium]|nr:hypothetical protein [Rhodospirillales bacterium]